MTQVATIKMDSPITSIRILETTGSSGEPSVPGNRALESNTPATVIDPDAALEMERLKVQLQQQCQLLESIVTRLTEHYDTALHAHREDIARLSVEIARKILVQKVRDQDYDIEAIVQQALSHAPCSHDVVIHINPADSALFLELQQTRPNSALASIQFVADDAVAPAECLVETPKGSINSCIDDHLDQIAKALIKDS